MENKRLEALLIWAFEHAIECSEQATKDLIRYTGITSDELEEIGYERDSFPEMHSWTEESVR